MTADYTRVTETESLQTYASVDRQLQALDGTNAKIENVPSNVPPND